MDAQWKEAQEFCSSSEGVPLAAVSHDSENITFTIGSEALSFSLSLQESQFFVETEELTDDWLVEASDAISENASIADALKACVRAFDKHPGGKEEEDSDNDDGEDLACMDDGDEEIPRKRTREPEEEEIDTSSFQVQGYERGAVMQIAKELKAVRNSSSEALGFTAGPLGDNLGHWEVKLNRIPKDEQIWADLEKIKMDCITFRIVFPPNYPFAPPYIRVLRPRFQILVDVMALMLDGGAKIDGPTTKAQGDYTEHEAKEAFNRMLQTHGWTHWKR